MSSTGDSLNSSSGNSSPGNSQYFEADPTAASTPRTIELVLPDVFLTLDTDSGVFSNRKVDSGSRYLLQEHPPISDERANILDVGCGYGPIALAAAKRAPQATVWGLDVNARAIDLARRNAETNDIANAQFGTADDVPSELRFDVILSNPPIRIGKPALHALLTTWLDRLTPDGVAWMVVQKHLGSDSLAEWLTAEGWVTTRLGSRKGFRILETRARNSHAKERL